MKKEIKWGSIPIIGLDDMEQYTMQKQRAIENGNMRKYVPKDKNKEIGKKSGKSRIGRKASKEHKNKISNALKNKPKSEKHKKNLSKSRTGFKVSEETKNAISKRLKGKKNPMYGKNHSDETKNKISKNHGAKVIKTCPHCGKKCAANNYPRYHGDNCKFKK